LPTGSVLSSVRCDSVDLDAFSDFLRDGLHRSPVTAQKYRRLLRKFFDCEDEISRESIMRYLKALRDKTATKANFLKGLFRLCKDYLGRPDLVVGFRIPKIKCGLKEALADADVRRGFELLRDIRQRALYIMYATTGVRRTELLKAKLEDLDLEARVLRIDHESETKKAGVAVFNEEARHVLKEWLKDRAERLKGRGPPSDRLFPMDTREFKAIWKRLRQAGLQITPKELRFWHSTKLGELRVPDRYVDILQGRAPLTVLQKHYTGTGLETLKKIYDEAGLKVLN